MRRVNSIVVNGDVAYEGASVDNSRKTEMLPLAVKCFVIIVIAGIIIAIVLNSAQRHRPYMVPPQEPLSGGNGGNTGHRKGIPITNSSLYGHPRAKNFRHFVANFQMGVVAGEPYMLSSKGARTLDEKVQKIEPHFKLRSKIEDIEYHCEVHPSTIGPSHYRDVIAVKVASSDIDKWLGNYYYSSAYDGEKLLSAIEKSDGILLTNVIWRHSSKSKVYVNGTNKIIVFKAEGILIIQRSK